MVPCLDMANHTGDANSYYEQISNGDITLLLRPNKKIEGGTEITISYGVSKTAAEMLFSYGFLDEKTPVKNMALALEPIAGDPLGRAKFAAFHGPPVVNISSEEASSWSSPLLYFMCLNEEDGLDFRVLQQVDGSRSQLRVFWQDVDVTDSTDQFEQHIEEHPMRDVFLLRAVSLLQDHIQQQLERAENSVNMCEAVESSMVILDQNIWVAAMYLRDLEITILEDVLHKLQYQVSLFMQCQKHTTTTRLIIRVGRLTSEEPCCSGISQLHDGRS
jgi:hypothetical protein